MSGALAGVVPAAGFSSRMGRFKPLVDLGGKTALARVVDCLRQAEVENVVVVGGHQAGKVRAEASRLGADFVFNREFASGMLTSIQAGVRALPTETEAFFILPVDIPLVRPLTLKALLHARKESDAAVLCPVFQESPGHPPLISRELIPAILAYDGPNGLGGLFDSLGDRARGIGVWDRNILLDMDRPKDLKVLRARLARYGVLDRHEAWTLLNDILDIPPQGVAHGRKVGETALLLAKAVNQAGGNVDPEMAMACGLLHDLAKGQPNHEEAGAGMLEDMGLHPMARVVGRHRDVPPPVDGRLDEAALVCLADKLVRGPERVGVRQRFEEKLAVFGADPEARAAILGRMQNALALQDLVERKTGKSLSEILDDGPE